MFITFFLKCLSFFGFSRLKEFFYFCIHSVNIYGLNI